MVRKQVGKKSEQFVKLLTVAPQKVDKKFIRKQLSSAPYCQQLNRLASNIGMENKLNLMRYDYSSDIAPVTKELKKTKGKNTKGKNTKGKKSKKSEVPSKLRASSKPAQPPKTNDAPLKKPEPEVKLTDFSIWLKNLSNPSKSLQSKELTKKSKSKKSKTKDTTKKARTLLKEKIKASNDIRPEIVSEQLAELYVSQGHIKRAMKCYKKLSLNNPQKSSYFAARIKELKRLL